MNAITEQKRTNSGIWRELRYDLSKTPDLARYFARNPYAWPGGYPVYAITDDGGALCRNCVKSEYRIIRDSYPGDGWHIVATDINYEDGNLFCDHCGNNIESAYDPDPTPDCLENVQTKTS